jgi:hypothetical protein
MQAFIPWSADMHEPRNVLLSKGIQVCISFKQSRDCICFPKSVPSAVTVLDLLLVGFGLAIVLALVNLVTNSILSSEGTVMSVSCMRFESKSNMAG